MPCHSWGVKDCSRLVGGLGLAMGTGFTIDAGCGGAGRTASASWDGCCGAEAASSLPAAAWGAGSVSDGVASMGSTAEASEGWVPCMSNGS